MNVAARGPTAIPGNERTPGRSPGSFMETEPRDRLLGDDRPGHVVVDVAAEEVGARGQGGEDLVLLAR